MKNPSTSVILLAGGSGQRFGSSAPKQFLPLHGKPIASHSFDCFRAMEEIAEVIVVCHPQWQPLFSEANRFALPGDSRQNSVYNGLQLTSQTSQYVCIHDAARPLINPPLIRRVLEAAYQHGAAASGNPLSFTIKEIDQQKMVQRTPNRNHYWEVQTPQALRRDWLVEGFQHIHREQITVTDDVSIAELLGKPVAIVKGASWNLKITNPQDLMIAEHLYHHCHE